MALGKDVLLVEVVALMALMTLVALMGLIEAEVEVEVEAVRVVVLTDAVMTTIKRVLGLGLSGVTLV